MVDPHQQTSLSVPDIPLRQWKLLSYESMYQKLPHWPDEWINISLYMRINKVDSACEVTHSTFINDVLF